MRKILYISGTRADYGLMRQALFAIRKHPGLKLEIIVCGMHLMPEFGMTVKDIIKDGFKIHRVPVVSRKDNLESMARFAGELTKELPAFITRINPDIILVLGDRAEMLAASVVGAYLGIPVVHIHGGEVSSTVDESSRHAITKLAHLHLPATSMAAKRIIRMGEEPWRVRVVGSPGLDAIKKERISSPAVLYRKYRLNSSLPVVLAIQHPVSVEIKRAARQMKDTLQALEELKCQAIVIYPNADAGGRAMIRVIKQYKNNPLIRAYKNIPRADYLGLMKIAAAMVGNSSSAIIEAPYFKLRAVNIGTRQFGRERAGNIIDANYGKENIKAALKKALRAGRLKKCVSPYGRTGTAERIAAILATLRINEKLLQKRMSY